MSLGIELLGLVKAANTGLLLWDAVGPLVERFLESGQDATPEEVDAVASQAGLDIDGLKAAVARAKAEGR